jgi:enoyl-[acyl-carrier protein] reductase I
MNLKDKKILITGILNHRSIAYHVMKKAKSLNANIWITCQNDRIKSKIEKQLKKDNIKDINVSILDVTKKDDFINLKKIIEKKFGSLDGILHSIAYADINSFSKKFIDLTDKEIDSASNISATSLHTLTKTMKPLLNEFSSIISLSLDVSQIIPNYNAMAIAKNQLEFISKYIANDLGEYNNTRVNVIQSNPIKTIASSIIPKPENFDSQIIKNSMIKQMVNAEDIANLASFLFSDLSLKITGETIAVDCGLKKKKIFEF